MSHADDQDAFQNSINAFSAYKLNFQLKINIFSVGCVKGYIEFAIYLILPPWELANSKRECNGTGYTKIGLK